MIVIYPEKDYLDYFNSKAYLEVVSKASKWSANRGAVRAPRHTGVAGAGRGNPPRVSSLTLV